MFGPPSGRPFAYIGYLRVADGVGYWAICPAFPSPVWSRRLCFLSQFGGYLANALAAFMQSSDCAVVRAHLAFVFGRVSSGIELSWDEWGDGKWERSSSAQCSGLQRNRRTDYHLKQFVLHGSRLEGRTTTVGQAVRSVDATSRSSGVRWVEQELSAYRASCLLTFRETQCFAVCVDGARVGRPARELLLGFLTDPRADKHCALPPQALLYLGMSSVLGTDCGCRSV